MPHARRAIRALRLTVALGFAAGLLLGSPRPPSAWAQTAATAAVAKPLTQGELEALLAPIALYPDDLLMQVLMAATYPLELVQAERWLKQGGNAALKGDGLGKALEAQPWDPAVKSLVPFPPVLTMMNEQLDWTQRLGDAVLAQQTDVMNAVQSLRARADAAGKLASGAQQVVTKTSYSAAAAPEGGLAQQVYPTSVPPPRQVYSIAPTNPQTVYVPTYNPSVVYGAWPYPAYPPTYYPPPPALGVGNALLTGMAFATGVAVVSSLWGWGRPAWGGGYVNVNVNRYNAININRTQINSTTWRHDVAHRQGVAYRNPEVNNRFRGAEAGQRSTARDEFRGRTQQVQQAGGIRNAVGERGGQARPEAGAARDQLANRPNAGAARDQLANRPNTGAARDQLANRPNASAARDQLANRPNASAARDQLANRPNASAARDKVANRPNAGAAREQVANRPNAGAAREQVANRPPVQRPAQMPAGFQGLGNGGGERAAAARAQTSRQLPQMGGGGFGGGGGGFAANRPAGGGGFAGARGGGGGGRMGGGGGRFR